jgi:hypothetical protein
MTLLNAPALFRGQEGAGRGLDVPLMAVSF